MSKNKKKFWLIPVFAGGALFVGLMFLIGYFWIYPIAKTYTVDRTTNDETYVYDLTGTIWQYKNDKQNYMIIADFTNTTNYYSIEDGNFILHYEGKLYPINVSIVNGHGSPLAPVAACSNLLSVSIKEVYDCPIKLDMDVLEVVMADDCKSFTFDDLYIVYSSDVKGSGLNEDSEMKFTLTSGTVKNK